MSDKVVQGIVQKLYGDDEGTIDMEPTDPAARVIDKDGDEWAHVGEKWVTPGSHLFWEELVGRYSPLTMKGVK